MRTVFVVPVAFAAMFVGACSSKAPDAANGADVSASPVNNSVAAANVGPGTENVNHAPQSVGKRLEERKHRGSRTSTGTNGPQAELEFRACPENSQCATTMNEQGQPVEVRVFNDNAQLTRVEAVWIGAKEKLLKITLSSGTTIEVRTGEVADLASASAQQLVALARGQ